MKLFRIQHISYLTFFAALAFCLFRFWKLWIHFAFEYVDPDQLTMIFGAQEYAEGRFYSLRFLGQNYGSMLESLLAVPFLFLSDIVALTLVTTALLLVPYIFITWRVYSWKLGGWGVLLLFLASMPWEYYFIGTMPRDFVSGIAVTSVGIIWMNTHQPNKIWPLGLFCVLGWSLNHSAVLLAAFILTYSLFQGQEQWRKRAAFLTLGMLLGLLFHFALDFFQDQRPEWIVYESWDLIFDPRLIVKAGSNLDMHLAALVPFFYGKSIIYFVLLFLLLTLAGLKKDIRLFLSISVFVLLSGLSLGLNKVHDGFQSIFSPYERMFLSFPVVLYLALLIVLKIKKWYLIMTICLISIAVNWRYFFNLDQRIAERIAPTEEHLMPFAKMKDVRARIRFLNSLAKAHRADVILVGPQHNYLDELAASLQVGFDEGIHIIKPEFDRKMRIVDEVNKPNFERVLWLSEVIEGNNGSMSRTIELHTLRPSGDRFKLENYYHLIEGERLNPIEVYRSFGFHTAKTKADWQNAAIRL